MPTSNLLCSASSRRCERSRATCAAWTPRPLFCDLDRGVGHLGRHLQLDLLHLRLHLVQLHTRPRRRRLLRAQAERIADVHRNGPRGIAVPEQRRRARRRQPPGIDPGHLAADAGAGRDQLRAAQTLHAVVRRCRSACGSVWSRRYFSVMSLASTFFFAISMSVRSLSARRIAASMSIGSGWKSGRSVGSMRGAPVRVVGAADDQPLQRQFGRAPRDSAVTSAWRRVACSDCAWTTSIGAIVPTSTRVWLSCTSLLARSSDCRATSTACVAKT